MILPLLAFTLFYDPVTALYPNMDEYWLWLVVPLVIAVSLVYKCTRISSLRDLPRDIAIMSTQILIVMVIGAGLLAAGYWAYIRIPLLMH